MRLVRSAGPLCPQVLARKEGSSFRGGHAARRERRVGETRDGSLQKMHFQVPCDGAQSERLLRRSRANNTAAPCFRESVQQEQRGIPERLSTLPREKIENH